MAAKASALPGAFYPTERTTVDECDRALKRLSVEAVKDGWAEPLRVCVDRWLDCRHDLTCPDRTVRVPFLSRS